MLTCQKARFSLPGSVHYLNCAYMSPKSRAVESAAIAAIGRSRDPSRITVHDFFQDADRIRDRFARLVNADDPARVAIVPAASYGLATAARNTEIVQGQNVVLLHEEFPSNVYIWRRLAADRGAEVRIVQPPEDDADRGRRWNERILNAIDGDTAVVALGHVHWADGTRFDLQSIGARAREVGAALVVDGTQSVGALPLDVQRIRPDALVCAGYKWLLGPYGLGVAWFGPRYDGGVPLEENWINRRGSDDFAALVIYDDEYRDKAVRYDVGEKSSFLLAPMLVSALEEILGWGVAAIQAYCAGLLAGPLAEAEALGYRVEEAAWRAGHLVGLRTPPGLPLDRLRLAMEEHRVFVSLRGSAVRVSPHLYNDEVDAAALADALRAPLA